MYSEIRIETAKNYFLANFGPFGKTKVGMSTSSDNLPHFIETIANEKNVKNRV